MEIWSASACALGIAGLAVLIALHPVRPFRLSPDRPARVLPSHAGRGQPHRPASHRPTGRDHRPQRDRPRAGIIQPSPGNHAIPGRGPGSDHRRFEWNHRNPAGIVRFKRLLTKREEFRIHPHPDPPVRRRSRSLCRPPLPLPRRRSQSPPFRQYPLRSLPQRPGYGGSPIGDLEWIGERGQEAYTGTDHVGKTGLETALRIRAARGNRFKSN